jgi:hypothetical protein
MSTWLPDGELQAPAWGGVVLGVQVECDPPVFLEDIDDEVLAACR